MEAKATLCTGLEAVTRLHRALQDVGLGRTSRLAGGELTGWTTAYGSTGFSIRKEADGKLVWHLVLSGKQHLTYRTFEERRDGETYALHEPTNPERLFGRLRDVFANLGVAAQTVSHSGHQNMWDDDVEYEVTTGYPEWLEPFKEVARVRRNPWF